VPAAGRAFVTADSIFLGGETADLGDAAPEIGPVTFGAGIALFESTLPVIGDPVIRVSYLGFEDRLLVVLAAGGHDEDCRQ
jgi:hypothetical protein